MAGACGQEAPEPVGEEIDCAIGTGADFSPVCTLERTVIDGADVFVVHHPDGGFRLFAFDEGGIRSVDGAAEVRVNVDADPAMRVVEFSVAQDRYRIPAEPSPGA
ncbi:hypothetical protein MTsPCn3_00570 [Erythrobacter sp. MTPC3]